MKTLLSILKGIKSGLSTAFRKVKSSKRLQGALVLVCIMAVVFGVWFGGYSKGTKVHQTIQKPVVCYKNIEEIAFQEATIKEFDNPVTTSNYIFTFNAVIKAGYDLENIKDDGGNELTQTITVTLPKASIFDSYLDEKSYVQYWNGEKITANVGLDDIHKEKKRMPKEAKQDAIKGGLYEKTAEHAKVVITDYIHSLKGYENYNVVFNELNDKA